MMDSQTPLRIDFSDCETVIQQVTQDLEQAGLRVVRSFDLRSACGSLDGNVCPHHGTAPCDCQLVVLLVYGMGTTPASLLFHSHRGQTEIQLDKTPEAHPNSELKAQIYRVLNGEEALPLLLDCYFPLNPPMQLPVERQLQRR